MSLAVPHVRREPARVQHRRVREARPVPPAQNAEGQLRLRHHRRAHCPRRPQRSPKCRRLAVRHLNLYLHNYITPPREFPPGTFVYGTVP